jgi:transcriptional regulator with XRE-family HTH domain
MLYAESSARTLAPLTLRSMVESEEKARLSREQREAAGRRLAEAIEHQKMDSTAGRKVLANALGVTTAAIGQALAGRTMLTAPNMAKAARELGVSCYWLATGEGEMGEQFSPEAARVAQQIDALRKDPDPDRLKWALQVAGLVFTRRPQSASEMVALVASLSAEVQPMPVHPTHQ